ncbi:hypothetical protein NX722_28585 [Endozoicomonas gorgoniicola]|uniref:Uncharacterized protein n=2 Tax=Endozoicomonas gorgoniicola TaxID=1234144 RepID=A0ABT3N5J0_9GAMM|nr:hypothetical protein [Endozoicomonas gorgoniicola]MCW7556454.1 hypothetical protein [Endozoicomonas gorgoniicola]MCW7556525.1 hypothetical protein [Endozoicomonas gorgoniicola]
MNCRRLKQDCSDLSFSTMPVIEKHRDGLVVKCVRFESGDKE